MTETRRRSPLTPEEREGLQTLPEGLVTVRGRRAARAVKEGGFVPVLSDSHAPKTWRARVVVPGKPQTKGSVKAFLPPGGRFPVVKNDNERAKSWQMELHFAMRRYAPRQPWKEPMGLRVTFYFQRPASHYGTGKGRYTVKASAPALPTVKPDLDKCLRVILDAGTGTWWFDDSYLVDLAGARKEYAAEGTPERVEIEAWVVEASR